MEIDFINSEICKIDDKEMVYFSHPNVLLNKIENVLNTIGAEKFFSSPSEDVKKARENIAEYFFIVALKKITGKDWFLMQPKKDPPDFYLTTTNSDYKNVTLDKFELVEIPPDKYCQTFEKMMDIIQRKIDKKYSEKYSLLIFVNNKKSKEWINLLHRQLKNYNPFKAIWTISLLQYKCKNSSYGSVVNKLRPYPAKSIEVELNDKALHQYSPIPNYMEEIKVGDKLFFKPKSDFIKELRKFNLLAKKQKNDEKIN